MSSETTRKANAKPAAGEDSAPAAARNYDAFYRKRLDALLDTTADGIITIDAKGTVESFNRACESIFGYDADEVIGRNIRMLMPAPYATEHDGYLSNYLKTGLGKVIGIGREVEARRKNGEVFPIDLSVGQFELDGVRYFSGIIRDITARKQAEMQLIRSNIELERFAYIASHDLQEPMRMVANFTELLQAEYNDRLDDTGRQYIRFITGAARRMQALVTDLLEYSRAGKDDLEFQRVDTEEKVRVVLQDLGEVIAEKKAVITLGRLPVIHSNPMHFVRLVQNLIGNALKYAKKDVAPVISVGAETTPDSYIFSVQDNGIGIAPEYLEDVFIIFKRLHKRSEYDGTGIGLSICKRVAESLGGKIWVRSQPGEGSTFYFTIPRHPDEKREAGKEGEDK